MDKNKGDEKMNAMLNNIIDEDADEEIVIREEDLTEEQKKARLEWSRQFINTLNETMGIVRGEITFPANRLTFKQKMEKWKKMTEEIDD